MLRTSAVVIASLMLLGSTACGPSDKIPVPGREGAEKTMASSRAQRRAFDGAPAVVPHEDFGDCTSCHDLEGVEIPDVGFAPAYPHERTEGMGRTARCRQCHVFRLTDERFVENGFVALRQDLRGGARAQLGAPPVIPHHTFMRENCAGCHDGPAAREEVRTSHPERTRCRQCHVPAVTRATFDGET